MQRDCEFGWSTLGDIAIVLRFVRCWKEVQSNNKKAETGCYTIYDQKEDRHWKRHGANGKGLRRETEHT